MSARRRTPTLTGTVVAERDGDASASGPAFQIAASRGNPLLGSHSGQECLPYLDDHRIEGVAVLPASVYVEMALAAAVEVFRRTIRCAERCRISQGAFPARRRNPDDSGDPFSGRGRSGIFHIYSCPRGDAEQLPIRSWTLHATGKVCPQQDEQHHPGLSGMRRSRKSGLDARRRSPARTITETPRKRYPLRALLSRALLSCGEQR